MPDRNPVLADRATLLVNALAAAERAEADLPHVLVVRAEAAEPLLLGPYDTGLQALVALQWLDQEMDGDGVVELSVAPLHPPQERV